MTPGEHGSWEIEVYDKIEKEWQDVTTTADKDYESVSRALLLFMQRNEDVRITWRTTNTQNLSVYHQEELFTIGETDSEGPS